MSRLAGWTLQLAQLLLQLVPLFLELSETLLEVRGPRLTRFHARWAESPDVSSQVLRVGVAQSTAEGRHQGAFAVEEANGNLGVADASLPGAAAEIRDRGHAGLHFLAPAVCTVAD